MGRLENGIWVTQEPIALTNTSGAFQRPATTFRSKVTADGSSGFPAVSGRYHIYVSYACPWAHRTLIMRSLKGLEDDISVSVVEPVTDDFGWRFTENRPDHLFGSDNIYRLYVRADPTYTGRASVPIFWDKELNTIVSNESADIIEFLNDAFPGPDFYPTALRPEINELNDFIYNKINNGVYKCGFAKSQDAYESAFDALFEALDTLEIRLETQRYLFGSALTIADIRLFTTLLRFDPVYFTHFKTNLRLIDSYKNLSGYVRDVYQYPGVAETVNMSDIKTHYFTMNWINPSLVVAKGPKIDFTTPHGREHLG